LVNSFIGSYLFSSTAIKTAAADIEAIIIGAIRVFELNSTALDRSGST
jgi:hypothetical protein